MEKRFQVKKLNKDDHKGIKNSAGAVKKILSALGIFTLLAPVVKKYGKDVVEIVKK